MGTVQSSEALLGTLIEMGENVVGVVTRASSSFNADYRDLGPLCEQHGIPCWHVGPTLAPEDIAYLHALKPDCIFCFGWSHLLPRSVLEAAPLGVLGFHPAPLPIGRGRHPIIWALALGMERTASTFFMMDDGADSGAIVSQHPVDIAPTDTAAVLYANLVEAAQAQLRQFVPRLKDGRLVPTPQDDSRATHWRKRGKADGHIDFRMSAVAVHNLVRALSEPYVGAHLVCGGQETTVWEARPEPCPELHHEPGKVLESSGGTVLVKCGQDAIRLVRHGFLELPAAGTYIL